MLTVIQLNLQCTLLVVASRLTLGYFGCPGVTGTKHGCSDVEGTSLLAANDRSRFFIEIENELI